MRVLKRIIAFIYLVSAVLVLGAFAGYLYSPESGRFEALFDVPAARIALLVCMVILALGTLVGACRMLFARREIKCVHPDANPDIEVSLAAVESVARTAAAQDSRALIERVEGRVRGRDASEVAIRIEAIALGNHDLAEHAQAMQQRVTRACEQMLGAKDVTVRVRFLPSKTTIVTQEVSHE